MAAKPAKPAKYGSTSRPNNGGRRPGAGRPKGVPNKATAAARESFRMFVEGHAGEFDSLYRRVAKKNPYLAMDMVMKVAEYVLPKLQRTELTGPDGGPVQYEEAEARRQNLDAINRLSERIPGAAPSAPAPGATDPDPSEPDNGSGS